MAMVTTDNQHYADIAAAIRERNGLSDAYLPSQMPEAIRNIPNAEETLVSKTGTIRLKYTADAASVATGLSEIRHLYILCHSTHLYGVAGAVFAEGSPGLCAMGTGVGKMSLSLSAQNYLSVSGGTFDFSAALTQGNGSSTLSYTWTAYGIE